MQICVIVAAMVNAPPPPGAPVVAIATAKPKGRWQLGDVAFMSSNGAVGKMCLDTGADWTVVTSTFAKRAGLTVRPLDPSLAGRLVVRGANGGLLPPVGMADVTVQVQLILQSEDGVTTHWDRRFCLQDVLVVDAPAESPRDLYVSFQDWGWNPLSAEAPSAPLANLAYLVASGATVYDERRMPPADATKLRLKVAAVTAVAAEPVPTLEEQVLARMPEGVRASNAAARKLAKELGERFPDLNSSVDPSKCTVTIDFVLTGVPKPVGHKVGLPRSVSPEAFEAEMRSYVERGFMEWVPASEPAYGFSIVVPKPGGKFRICYNPTGINSVTERINPEGGVMPSDMIAEAWRVRGLRVAIKMDLRDAFNTFKLGETARRLSTFMTPMGKVRMKQGWFGWHSFPNAFQQLMLERVVMPTLEKFGHGVAILDWIDDLVIAAINDELLGEAALYAISLMHALGARLSLGKCHFFVTQFEWCGVEVNLATNEWRMHPDRTASVKTMAVPEDRVQLQHVLGVLRYYWLTVRDQKAQRARLALLSSLDEKGASIKALWTEKHTVALREACDAICSGDWLMVYDPSAELVITTDASGDHGYSCVVNQFDKVTGVLRPLAFYSSGWKGPQCTWTAQAKEAYAQRWALFDVAYRHFRYAPQILLLCDNKNLAGIATSKEPKVARWQADITAYGALQRSWIPGDWNSIADYASRVVTADPGAKLSAAEVHELRIDAVVLSALGIEVTAGAATRVDSPAVGGAGAPTPAPVEDVVADTVVYGHLAMAPLLARIAEAQMYAPEEETMEWEGPDYQAVVLGERRLVLFKSRAIVPRGAKDLKVVLMSQAHDALYHYGAAALTLQTLQRSAHVWWEGMAADVMNFVKSCARCQLATDHGLSKVGTLTPTVAPTVHHTWYMDFKGPMPGKSGYILGVVEAFTRMTRLRFMPTNTAEELIEELEEVATIYGTYPVVIRSDNGPPFNSEAFKRWCGARGIMHVPGIPYHSQGQGKVETRFRGVANALMATLGARASYEWCDPPHLARLEMIMNSMYCEPLGGSPFWAMYGRDPRTALSASADWTSATFGSDVLDAPKLTYDDLMNIIAESHGRIRASQGLALLGSSVAQAVTKGAYDAKSKPSTFVVGQDVAVYRAAPNRLEPHFVGPYRVVELDKTRNFATLVHFLGGPRVGPIHVSRLIHFDASRASKAELTDAQLGVGQRVVTEVLGHRIAGDGSTEVHLAWYGTPITTWEPLCNQKLVTMVQKYCADNGIAMPAAPAPAVLGRGGRRAAAAAAGK